MSGALQQLELFLRKLGRQGATYPVHQLNENGALADELSALVRAASTPEHQILLHGEGTLPATAWHSPEQPWWGTTDARYASGINSWEKDDGTFAGALHVLGFDPRGRRQVATPFNTGSRSHIDPGALLDMERSARAGMGGGYVHMAPDDIERALRELGSPRAPVTEFRFPKEPLREDEWLIDPRVPIRRYLNGGSV